MSISRNQPCPCGSGKKYKRCCGAIARSPASGTDAVDLESAAIKSQPDIQLDSLPSRVYELHTGVKISAPDSLELLTPYILTEQQDWFEDEIEFIRHFVKPGMNIIDIGANYGVYTFSMAQETRNLGKIWAFEPTSAVMKQLQYSKQLNLANNVELMHCALSDHCGEARLSLNANPELNHLGVDNDDHDNASELVTLRTLDDFMTSIQAKSIDFMKLDAEGAELDILKGGKEFFQTFSPMVMYEFKHSGSANTALISALDDIGYKSYRLVPGLNMLVPLEASDYQRHFLLNLFACNTPCAARLEKQNLLITDPSAHCELPDNPEDYLAGYYQHSPLTSEMADIWNQLAEAELQQTNNILALYMMAHDTKLSALVRYSALKLALQKSQETLATKPEYSDLATYARIATELGERAQAINALQTASQLFNDTQTVDIRKPTLAATAAYDSIEPGSRAAQWLISSIIEAAENLRHWSSFYTGDSAMSNLMFIKENGFASNAALRRIATLEQRYMNRQKSGQRA